MKSIRAFIILLSVQVPFNIAFFFAWLHISETFPEAPFVTVYAIIAVLYFTALSVLGLKSIISSFLAFKRDDFNYCIKAHMTLKYGLVPFFTVNFISITLLAFGLTVGSRGFFLIPMIPFVIFAIFCTWIAILPGAFFGFQVMRYAYKEHKTGLLSTIFHTFLQFCFVVDVLDTIYITAIKFKRGRKAGAVIFAVFIVEAVLAGIALYLLISNLA